MKTRSIRLLSLAAAALALAACGGGGGGGTDGTGAPTAAITSSGAMLRGSVILNGIRFDDTAATVTDDRGRGTAALANGMVVKVRGRSDDGTTGRADRVEIENEVRAAITAIDAASDPQSFTVGGLVVLVDSGTVFANVTGGSFAGLTVGTRVEVHGLRDAAGNVRATRVEAVGAQDGADELRGTVSAPNTTADRFTLNGNVTVNYAGATFSPATADESALVANAVVEVHGSFDLTGTLFTATRVDIEDLEDDNFRGAAGEKQEVEGFVSGFSAHPGSFQVNGRSVTTIGSTRFQGGTAADLTNGIKVEAEGAIDAQGVLVASKIEFKQTRVLLHGLATTVNAGNNTLVVLGQTVSLDDLTRVSARAAGGGGNSTALTDIVANTDCVEVRGFLDGTRIVAQEVTEPSGCGDDLVQARVTAENETTFTLTFFGGLNAVLANAQFQDDNEAPLTRAQFFAAVTPAGTNQAGTLVKVRGSFAGGVLTVDEAELED